MLVGGTSKDHNIGSFTQGLGWMLMPKGKYLSGFLSSSKDFDGLVKYKINLDHLWEWKSICWLFQPLQFCALLSLLSPKYQDLQYGIWYLEKCIWYFLVVFCIGVRKTYIPYTYTYIIQCIAMSEWFKEMSFQLVVSLPFLFTFCVSVELAAVERG